MMHRDSTHRWRSRRPAVAALVTLMVACSDPQPPQAGAANDGPIGPEASAAEASTPADPDGSPPADSEGFLSDVSVADAAGDAPIGDLQGSSVSAAAWIRQHFAGAPKLTGTFSKRTSVEAPRLVESATSKGAPKYAFFFTDKDAPDVATREVGFIDVRVESMKVQSSYGGCVSVSKNTAGSVWYMSNFHCEPDWPKWVSYSQTNYDGLVLNAAKAIYAEDLTIKNWNADAAIDNKAQVSQFVRLTVVGSGHRALRYWRDGPHYLVDSKIGSASNPTKGTMIWGKKCATLTIYVYNSTFNGAPTVPKGQISCNDKTKPKIVYLKSDPRKAGKMHPMFGP